jgi:hypothetical protein
LDAFYYLKQNEYKEYKIFAPESSGAKSGRGGHNRIQPV